MGAWRFLSTRLRETIGPSIELVYVGRPESASPAEGFGPRHKAEQARIVSVALDAAPGAKDAKRNGNGARETLPVETNSLRSEATHAR